MIRSNSPILSTNSSRTGKAISASSFSGVRSSFSGGRRMVKCTRSTDGSAFSSRRHVRSPWCGSPEISSTRSRSRTPLISTTARLFSCDTSPGQRAGGHLDHRGTGAGDRHLDPLLHPHRHAFGAERLAVAANRQRRRAGAAGDTQIVDRDPQDDRLADDAVPGRLDHPQPAVGFLAACRSAAGSAAPRRAWRSARRATARR